jgi:hypothetical protein
MRLVRQIFCCNILVFSALLAFAQKPITALDLNHRLSNVGLDSKQVFNIRNGALDLEDLHFSFNDGTIAFTEAVDGRVTGAFFVGEGELLIVPPSQVERQTLQQFTGAAVLSEQFRVAYFRFSDASVIDRLRPAMRAESSEVAAEFIEQNNSTAHTLAQTDALRSLIALTRADTPANRGKRFLRARLSGVKLGAFDVLFDSELSEQVSIGQVRYTADGAFYDQWMSFPMRSVRKSATRRTHTTDENASFDSRGNAGGDPGSLDDVQVHNVKINAVVKPPTDLAAEADVDLIVRSGGERTVVFELSRYLKVSSVVQVFAEKTAPVEFIQNDAIEGSQLARRGNDLVAVVFAEPLRDGQQILLRLTYQGPVMSAAGGGLVYVGAKGSWCPNRGMAMADYQMKFRAPAEWKLIATGERISSTVDPDTKDEITVWDTHGPVPLAGFNLGRYQMAGVTAKIKSANGGLPRVETYAARGMEDVFKVKQLSPTNVTRMNKRSDNILNDPAPSPTPDPAKQMLTISEQAAQSIDYNAANITPYPFASLSITQMPGHNSQGWPGLVYLSSYVYLKDSERPNTLGIEPYVNNLLYDRVMVPHEVAHQWWGNTVTSKSYRDNWLMEAISQYLALMQLEKDDHEGFQKILDYYRTDLMREVHEAPLYEAGPVSLGSRLYSSRYPDSYDDIIYGRGAWLMHMVRMMLRDENPNASQQNANLDAERGIVSGPDARFFAALRTLQQKGRGTAISVRDLQTAVQAVLPKELYFEDDHALEWFFQGWIEGTAMPSYSLDKVKIIPSKSAPAAQRSSAGQKLPAIQKPIVGQQTTSKWTATFVLKQDNAPDQLITAVPIYAENASGSLTFLARVFADGPESEVSITVPSDTKRIVVDPFHTILTRP